jgi:hypothetical protein
MELYFHYPICLHGMVMKSLDMSSWHHTSLSTGMTYLYTLSINILCEWNLMFLIVMAGHILYHKVLMITYKYCHLPLRVGVILCWRQMLTGAWIRRRSYSVNESLSSRSSMHSAVSHFKAGRCQQADNQQWPHSTLLGMCWWSLSSSGTSVSPVSWSFPQAKGETLRALEFRMSFTMPDECDSGRTVTALYGFDTCIVRTVHELYTTKIELPL